MNPFSKIRTRLLTALAFLPAILLILPAGGGFSQPAVNPDRVLDVYGPEIAGYYRRVQGMPVFAVDSACIRTAASKTAV